MAITIPRDPEAWAKLGKTIREHREEAGLSRRALAEKAGVSEKSIQVAEEGRVPRGRMPQSLSRIGDALGWFPGSYISILQGRTWGRMETREVDVELGPPPSESATPKQPVPGSSLATSGRSVELTQAGHLAQDVFMRQAARYRKLRGVPVEQLAEALAGKEPVLREGDIRRLEDGTRLLRMEEARAIAEALGTTVDWLLGSGFSSDAPEEMRRPPDDKELEAEANAVMRRMGELGAHLADARDRAEHAREREAAARAEAQMAMAMVQSAAAQQAEMEKHYQYLLGRIDSFRAARGEETAIQMVPIYEEEDVL